MAQVIRPEDFNKNTADPNRGRWTHAQMSAVVEALDGASVLIETDNGTGHAWEYRLTSMSYYHTGGSVLAVNDVTPHGCWFPLYKVGVIMDPRPGGKAKWDAVDIWRKAQRASV